MLARDDLEKSRLETVVICVLVDSFVMWKTLTPGSLSEYHCFKAGLVPIFSIETMDRGDTLDDGFRYSLLHRLD